MMKKLFILFIFLICFTQGSFAQDDDHTHEFRSVLLRELPAATNYVNDFEHIFSNAEIDALNMLLAEMEKSTSVEIAVVSLDSSFVLPDFFDAGAFEIANAWGVGKKSKNNGILIAISKSQRRMRIQNGNGLGEIVSDQQTQEVIDNVFIPDYRYGRYYEGTIRGVNAFLALIKKQ